MQVVDKERGEVVSAVDRIARRAQADSETPCTASFANWLPKPMSDPVLARRVKRVRWDVFAVAASIGAAWVGLILATIHFRGQLLIGFSVPLALAGSFALRLVRRRTAFADLAGLVDVPSVVQQFPVELVYAVEKAEYGSDAGVISFVDDWLHFQGRRTSWSLQASEVTLLGPEVCVGRNSGSLFKTRSFRALQWRSWEHANFFVHVHPLDRLEGVGVGLRKQLARQLIEWRRTSVVAPAHRVWPPRSAMPGRVRQLEVQLNRWNLARGASLAIVIATLSCYSFYLDERSYVYWFDALFVGGVLCFASVFVRSDIAQQLETIRRMCEGGEEVTFRYAEGPWWKGVAKPRDN